MAHTDQAVPSRRLSVLGNAYDTMGGQLPILTWRRVYVRLHTSLRAVDLDVPGKDYTKWRHNRHMCAQVRVEEACLVQI